MRSFEIRRDTPYGTRGKSSALQPRGLAATVGACALLATTLVASAQSREPMVQIEDCGVLQTEGIRRLLVLELGPSVRARLLDRMSLQVSCHGDRATLTLDDPLTGKVLLRTIPFPSSGAGRERTLALATSQLLLASFAELLLVPREDQTEGEVSDDSREARAAAEDVVDLDSEFELSALGAIRVRDWSEPFLTYAVGALARWEVARHLGIVSRLGFEFGWAARQSGDVLLRAGSAGIGIDYEWVSSDAFDLRSIVVVSLLYVHLLGEASATGFGGGVADGLSAEGSLGTLMSWRLDPLRLGVGVELGFTASTVLGLVEDGAAVDPGGVWAAGMLHVGVELR